jgi:hypothetical protein
MRLTLLLVTAATAAVFCPLYAGNILINPGFETGDFTGWSIGGNTTRFGVANGGTVIAGASTVPYGITTVEVNSGSNAAYALVACSGNEAICQPTPRQFIDLSQTVAVTPGQVDSVGFWEAVGASADGGFGQDIKNGGTQIYINGVGILPNLDFNANLVRNAYGPESGTFNTGAATSVTVTFEIDGSGGAIAGISLDDFFLNDAGPAAPEPQTWGLMGTALACMEFAVRRRGVAA